MLVILREIHIKSRANISVLVADAPHASFPFTKPGVQVPPRESIEVRALVFTYAT